MYDFDLIHMRDALQQAVCAIDSGDIPVGAVVVSPYGVVLGRGYNRVELAGTQVEHAEIVAIRNAVEQMKDWRLDGCTLYVTLEPCVMCFGAILLSRIERLVYAAPSPIYGYKNYISEKVERAYGGFLKNITTGVLRADAEIILRDFFDKKR